MFKGGSKDKPKDKETKGKDSKKDVKDKKVQESDTEDSSSAAPVQPAKVEPVVAAATSVAAAPAAGAPVDAAKPASSAAQVAAPSEADKKPIDRKAPAGREDSKISKADGAKKKEGDAKKKSKDKKDDDARRLADENVDEALEIAELEATKAHDENKDAFKELYSIFPQSVYTSYDKIKTFARDLNTQISHPEIVLLGPSSHGKSALLEAIIGRQFNVIGWGGATKRPLYLNIVNNLDCAEPRITLKRDSALHGQGFDRDMPVTLESLAGELQKRFSKEGRDPVFVQYEHRSSTNMTFIDTPGIPEEDSADYDAAVEAAIAIAKPTNRLLLCVEEANDWTKIRMIKILKQVDPDLSRTIFAYTKFNSQLSLFNSLAAVNRFLGGIVPDTKTFFVSLPSTKVRQKQASAEAYQEKVWQAYRRDMNNLETLQYDKRYERNIGLHALRKYLLNRIWKSYQEGVPEILKCLRTRKQTTQRNLQSLTSQAQTLDALKLRQIANQYCVEFLQTIDRLIAGTSEGTPTVSGQTLEEEKSAQGDVEWLDVYNHTIQFDAEKWGVPFWNSHIYGGQQFERLLAEFKAVCDHTEISEVSLDDVATAAGINKVNNVPNYAWAAADLAQHQTQDAFLPLIEQLQRRAVYVMKRLHDIAEKIMAAKKKKSSSTTGGGSSASSSSGVGQDHIDIEDIGLYPYFTNQVKDLFYKFIDNAAKTCRERCMDEFYSSKTIFWELTEFSDRKLPTDRTDKNPEDAKVAVSKLAADLFKSIRERITKNVLLKFYNFFLVPMQTDLWTEVQRRITTVSDEQLDQFFQVKTNKEKLKEDEKSLEQLLAKTTEQETQFLEIARQFTHPTHASAEGGAGAAPSDSKPAPKFGGARK
jgi:hypothetical protein